MIVGIITRRRPELLRRCLTNLAANARRFDHDPLFVVVDDGACNDDERATRDVAASIHARVSVLGATERMQLAERVSKRSDEIDLAEWALCRTERELFAPGAARNALLLATAGHKLLMVDDDTTGDFVSFDTRPNHRALDWDSLDPTRFRFFANRAAALDATSALPRGDVVGMVDDYLRSSCLAICGVVGHSGMQNPEYAVARGGENPEWAMTREVHRFVTEPILAPIGRCQTICVGLHGAVPPFPPHHPAEDGAFGAAMRASKPGQRAMFLPIAAVHDPPERGPAPDLTKVVRTNDVVRLLLGVCVPGPTQTVGPQLVALSRAGFFGELVANLADQAKPGSTVAPELGGSIERLSEHVEKYGLLMEAWPRMLTAALQAPALRPLPAGG